MSKKPSDDLTAWVSTWRRAGAALDSLRLRHVADTSEGAPARRLAAADDLIALALRHGRQRLTSGFVEQQRIFRKLAP